MTNIELVFNFITLGFAFIMVFLTWTAPNQFVKLMLNVIVKSSALFVMAFAIVNIFKHFNII